MIRILVIEDEVKLLEIIQFNLELEGYQVKGITNGKQAIEYKTELKNYDLVVLDVMLPEISGFDICRAYRDVSDIPILFISAKGSTIDRIAGLKLGANDYLPKPFDLEEFMLRCSALIQAKKKANLNLEEFVIGSHKVIPISYEVESIKTHKKEVLSKREMELLQLFYLHKDEVVSRELILSELWPNDQFPTGRTIDNYILSFRKLFEEDPKNPKYFHSIRGVGYKLTC